MSEHNRWERLKALMEEECALLSAFAAASDEVRTNLHGKDWQALEASLAALGGHADSVGQAEKRRHAAACRMAENGRPEELAASLSPEDRREFSRLRSKLRVGVAAVRSRVHGLGAFAESRTRLNRQILEELVPESRGRLYDRRGRLPSPARDALLVSRQL